MLHNVLFIRRRFPQSAGKIITALTVLSLSGLALGAGLLLLR
jgi:hypothetical protein